MELPKNVVQVGSIGKDYKVYVEDYVVSYLKELNRQAGDRSMAAALYGTEQIEEGVRYFFIYGAGKAESLKKEVRHLSQAQKQETERIRKRFFPEYDFVGYSFLEGSFIEGFYLFDQELCRYIEGYSQFYEKNEGMLNYLLEMRKEAEPEKISTEKYEEVQNRQKERREAARAQLVPDEPKIAGAVTGRINLQKLQLTAVGVFALLCMLGLATFRDGQMQSERDAQQELTPVGNFDSETKGASETVGLTVEEGLSEAVLEENQKQPAAGGSGSEDNLGGAANGATNGDLDKALNGDSNGALNGTSNGALNGTSKETSNGALNGTTNGTSNGASNKASNKASNGDSNGTSNEGSNEDSNKASNETSKEASSEDGKKGTETSTGVSGAVAYVIQPGDTLTAISLRQYGTDLRVADICNLNRIKDPDSIKEGQVIMLPR